MDLFLCDYSEGAHPKILEALTQTNLEQTCGYGLDHHCEEARELIRGACQAPNAAVHFLMGGTQANTTVIASILRPHQGALCADTGHINAHESGAIESTGHKVLPLPGYDGGKLSAAQVEQAISAHWNDENHEHTVQPGLVYISHPTEFGALYTLAELTALHKVCRKYGVPLFVDGARLGYGLTSDGTDLFLPDLARLADVFYIGGTKVGALFGEAVVITTPALDRDFRYILKQRGGMLAKGRLLGLQFKTLFTDGLYFAIAHHANEMAYQVRDIFVKNGYPLLFHSPSNQQFPILPDADYQAIAATAQGEFWQRVDETHSAYRFCTSWATTQEAVDRLAEAVANLHR